MSQGDFKVDPTLREGSVSTPNTRAQQGEGNLTLRDILDGRPYLAAALPSTPRGMADLACFAASLESDMIPSAAVPRITAFVLWLWDWQLKNSDTIAPAIRQAIRPLVCPGDDGLLMVVDGCFQLNLANSDPSEVALKALADNAQRGETTESLFIDWPGSDFAPIPDDIAAVVELAQIVRDEQHRIRDCEG